MRFVFPIIIIIIIASRDFKRFVAHYIIIM